MLLEAFRPRTLKASPRLAIVPYYLHRKDKKDGCFLCRYYERHRLRPRPLWGQGWRKGVVSLKKGFLQIKKKDYFFIRTSSCGNGISIPSAANRDAIRTLMASFTSSGILYAFAHT